MNSFTLQPVAEGILDELATAEDAVLQHAQIDPSAWRVVMQRERPAALRLVQDCESTLDT